MVSKLGLGTAAIGRPEYINIKQEVSSGFSMETFRARGLETLETAYELGIRYFDTAPGYGMAEQLLMDWSKSRNDIEIATKWGYTYVANFEKNAKKHEIKEHSLDKLNEQWNISKALLPNLSTYQIHSATLETGVLKNEAVLHRLAELRMKHSIKIGLTTTGQNQTEVLKIASDIEVDTVPLFDVFQVTYNVFDQSLVNVSSLFENTHRRLIIKEALANGRIFPNQKFTHYNPHYNLLDTLAKKYDVRIDAIALRFCMDSTPSFKVLSGAVQKSHLIDNILSEQFRLSEVDIESLRKLSIPPEDYWTERKQLSWN